MLLFLALHFRKLRHQIHEIGTVAVTSSGQHAVPRRLRQAALWLRDKELAIVSENKICLLTDAISTVVVVKRPIPVQQSANSKDWSIWFLKKCLNDKGWAPAKDSRSASSQNKKYLDDHCHCYYHLLFAHQDLLASAEPSFSHNGRAAYYGAVSASISQGVEDTFNAYRTYQYIRVIFECDS